MRTIRKRLLALLLTAAMLGTLFTAFRLLRPHQRRSEM